MAAAGANVANDSPADKKLGALTADKKFGSDASCWQQRVTQTSRMTLQRIKKLGDAHSG